MKIMVTGGAGFIGSAVVKVALKSGHTVLNVDKLTYAANLENLKDIEGDPCYRFEQADICDGESMLRLMTEFQPDTVMHLAAESHVDRSIDGPSDFIQTNIVGTFALLEAARSAREAGQLPGDFRFHHISTDEVFGSLGETGSFTEESPYRPNSPYSASKASSDMLVRAWGGTFNLPVVISNCSNNYGPYQFPEKLIPVVVEKARTGQPIPVYGTGENVRDWLYVYDHAEALLLIASKSVAGETYNVGGRAELTNIDLVKIICARLDEHFPDTGWGKHESLITFVNDRPGHDARYAVDCSKIERELGWTPRMTIEQGIADTIDWYLNNQAWMERIRNREKVGARLGLKKTG
ncbi:MAG: dTDP-glucose 4,6-dehydratase [Henriciella sp.]|jgi:dTDP-glucose 4,6-dehydratase